MSKLATENISKVNYSYPKTAIILTSSSGGRDNAMAAAWHSPISIKPPLHGVSVAPGRFSYRLITESKEFGINFVSLEKATLMAQVGGSSGLKIDKFKSFNIAKDKALKTGVPILKDAYAAYECKLVDARPYGDHIWMVGEIVAIHYSEDAFTPESIPDLDRVKPLIYLSSDFYTTIDKYTTTDKGSLQLIKRGRVK